MSKNETVDQARFRRRYTVAIDTVPLPESPADRMRVVLDSIAPTLGEIVEDATSVAIGTWPTPQHVRDLQRADDAMSDGLRAVGRGLRSLERSQMASVAALLAMTRAATLIEGSGTVRRSLEKFWDELQEVCPPTPVDAMERFGDCRDLELDYAIGMSRCRDEDKSESECEKENAGALEAAATCWMRQLEGLNDVLMEIPERVWSEPPIPWPNEKPH